VIRSAQKAQVSDRVGTVLSRHCSRTSATARLAPLRQLN
jgi:hypothetical protein